MRILKFIGGLAAVFVVFALGFLVWAHEPEIAAAAPPAAFERAVVERGEKLAAVGNCASCHTVAGGKPFAGGTPLPTPFGTLYGTNITPDPDTGIGTWPLAAFTRALRQGVDRAGNHLYPAFPYDHFARLADADVAALYAYLMTRQPVRATSPANALTFPLGFRPLLAGWKALFLSPEGAPRDAGATAEHNRGAYLVEALAHCGACHTPRNSLGAEERAHDLAGGASAGWLAPALDTENPAPMPWDQEALYAYLRRGHAPHHGASAGPMQEVARNLAGGEADDVRAIATYVAARMGAPSRERTERAAYLLAQAEGRLPAGAPRASAATVGASTTPAAAPGAVLYAGACAGCHDAGRTGYVDGIDLSLSTAVHLASPQNFLQIVLNGIHPGAGESGALMPGFADALTEAQITQLAAYVRATFSAQSPWPQLSDALARIRHGRAPLVTVSEAK